MIILDGFRGRRADRRLFAIHARVIAAAPNGSAAELSFNVPDAEMSCVMGIRPAEDVLPVTISRQSLAGRLTRSHRTTRTALIDTSSAPVVERGNDVGGAPPLQPAVDAVDVFVPDAPLGLATLCELQELAEERDQARERARAHRSDAMAAREAMAELASRHEALLAEEGARAEVLLEVSSCLAETRAALDGERAVHARQLQQLARDAGRESDLEDALRRARLEVASLKNSVREQAGRLAAVAASMQHHEDARHRMTSELARQDGEARTLRAALDVQAERHAAELTDQEAELQAKMAALLADLDVSQEAAGVSPEVVAELRADLAAVWADKQVLDAEVASSGTTRAALDEQVETLRQQVQHLTREREAERAAAAAEAGPLQSEVEELRFNLDEAREEVAASRAARTTLEAPDSKLALYLGEAEAKLSASEARRRAEAARFEALERELAQARAAAHDAQGGRRVAAQRAGEQKFLLAQVMQDNGALRGLVEVSREVCGAPGLGAEALLGLLPTTVQHLRTAVEVAQVEIASRDDRIRELEIAQARDSRTMPAQRVLGPSESDADTRGAKLLARLRDITQDVSASAQG